MKINNKKGFTIVELVIVIAVIAILAAVLIPTFSGITNRAKESARMQETRNSMMNYLAEQQSGVIADNTKFYYFENTIATGENVETYEFNYADGKLTAPTAVKKVNVTVTTESNVTTYKIGTDAAVLASDNDQILIVVPAAPADDE